MSEQAPEIHAGTVNAKPRGDRDTNRERTQKGFLNYANPGIPAYEDSKKVLLKTTSVIMDRNANVQNLSRDLVRKHSYFDGAQPNRVEKTEIQEKLKFEVSKKRFFGSSRLEKGIFANYIQHYGPDHRRAEYK